MLAVIFLVVCILFFLAYRYYAAFLERSLDVKTSDPTPAHTMKDGIDYDPAPAIVLFGHHFSTIAGNGPIVGPIIAALAFGWGPAILWIIIGCIFLGAPYDFMILIASLHNGGKSLGEIGRKYMGTFSYKLFLSFVTLALVYFILALVDVASTTFVPKDPEQAVQGGIVATASLYYLLLAIAFGIILRNIKKNSARKAVLVIFPILVFIMTFFARFCHFMPNVVPSIHSLQESWTLILMLYCFFASALPVWFLLQPRDYLSSFLLYACVLVGFLGIIASIFSPVVDVTYPAYITLNSKKLGPIFPIMFVTIACGAISGFHGVVSSGTTSKQLDKMSDARKIGYGAMLTEGILATIAISTVMIGTQGMTGTPINIFANGLAKMASVLGIPSDIVAVFALLAVSTFVLTSLDSATRLGRFVLQELVGGSNTLPNRLLFSLVICAIPSAVTLFHHGNQPIWEILWPAFGATNQLLAAFGLFFVYLWRRSLNKSTLFVSIPMVIMFLITLSAMARIVIQNLTNNGNHPLGVTCLVMAIMTFCILCDAIHKMYVDHKQKKHE